MFHFELHEAQLPSLEKSNCSDLITNGLNTVLHALTASKTQQCFETSICIISIM